MSKAFLRGAVALFFALVPGLASAEVSVRLKLDRSEAALADSISMVVSISGSRKSDTSPILRGVENFTVTEGGTSSRVEIINGMVKNGIDYAYVIQPKKTGTYQIGPAEVRIGGKTFQSNTEPLVVSTPAQSGGTHQGPLFISVGLSSKEIYVEEQAIYTLKLHYQTRVTNVALNLPEKEHLVFKQLGKPLQYQSIHNGQPYQVLEINYALIPSQEGNYTIGPAEMSMNVLQPGGGSPFGHLFDDPFLKDPLFSFQASRPATFTSEALELKVFPLPVKGRPADFSGLVGTFAIQSKLEPATIKAGESATLTLCVSGQGNVNLIPDLKVPELEQTKIYADQPVLQVEQGAKGIKGSKTMKWAIVPEQEGHLEIPTLKVSFFDPEHKQYKVLKTSPYTLSVLPGEKERIARSKAVSGEGGTEKSVKQQEVKELGHDIFPIHTGMKDLQVPHLARPQGWLFPLVLLAPLLVYLLALGTVKYKKQSLEALSETKARKAVRMFIKQLRLDGRNSNEVIQSLRGYLNNRFILSVGALTPDEAAEIVKTRGVSPGTTEKLCALIQRLDDAVYTGKGREVADNDMKENLLQVIKEMEKEIR